MSGRERISQLRGAIATTRGKHGAARLLAISDSRSLVRSLFLASMAETSLGVALARPVTLADLCERTQCTRPDRLRAWLDVGVETGELRMRGDRWQAHGRRARAIAEGDALITAQYRSMLEYQSGPYAHLGALLRCKPGEGRLDLEDYAATIADASLAAAPFIEPFLHEVVNLRHPVNALDVGCGTGVYTRALLDADPEIAVVGIDVATDVVDETRNRLRAEGYGSRVTLAAGDVRTWEPDPGTHFDLITLCNDLYYLLPEERVDAFSHLRGLLSNDGELVVVSLTRAGSIASAHLQLLLSCQEGEAALPARGEIERTLAEAGFDVVASEMLVPTEPFVGVRARPG
ncbi:MAG: 4-hydroxy-2,2-bipyrrole-5-carbaldehyde O-methyltransferase [Actinomycetota bacterium]|nr:4-hydroxy-2,2-bipyrrole-5-carbaldehyde O-methyltransferase [Actinomycetota bacterium]